MRVQLLPAAPESSESKPIRDRDRLLSASPEQSGVDRVDYSPPHCPATVHQNRSMPGRRKPNSVRRPDDEADASNLEGAPEWSGTGLENQGAQRCVSVRFDSPSANSWVGHWVRCGLQNRALLGSIPRRPAIFNCDVHRVPSGL